MEESGGSMRRYGVAAHERLADGRRSVRRRGEETAAGGRGWRIRGRDAGAAAGEERSSAQAWATWKSPNRLARLLLLLLLVRGDDTEENTRL